MQDHVCYVIDSPDERIDRVLSWAREGLAAGERVVVVASNDEATVLSNLLDDAPVRDGQLLFLPPNDVYLVEGEFDVDRRMAAHAAFIEQSVAEGYAGVRLAADAAVALAVFGDVDALAAYEQRVEALTRSLPVSGICFYDRSVFGPALHSLMAAHPTGVADRQLQGASEPGRVQLAGDVDVSNVDLLEVLLSGATGTSSDVTEVVVDLHELAFIDLAGMTALIEAAGRLGPQRRLKVHSPPRTVFTMFEAIGWSPNIDLVMSGAAA